MITYTQLIAYAAKLKRIHVQFTAERAYDSDTICSLIIDIRGEQQGRGAWARRHAILIDPTQDFTAVRDYIHQFVHGKPTSDPLRGMLMESRR